MEHFDCGIFPLLRNIIPPPNANNDVEQSLSQGGITVEGDLEQLNGSSIQSNSLSVSSRADGNCQLLHRWLESKRRIYRPLVEAFGNVRVELRRLGVQEGLEPPNPSFADESNVPQQNTVLIFNELRAAVSLPLRVYRLDVFIKSGLVAFPDACFEFADVNL